MVLCKLLTISYPVNKSLLCDVLFGDNLILSMLQETIAEYLPDILLPSFVSSRADGFF